MFDLCAYTQIGKLSVCKYSKDIQQAVHCSKYEKVVYTNIKRQCTTKSIGKLCIHRDNDDIERHSALLQVLESCVYIQIAMI